VAEDSARLNGSVSVDVATVLRKSALDIATAVKEARNQHRFFEDPEGDGDAPLESNDPDAGTQIATKRTPFREDIEPFAAGPQAVQVSSRGAIACTLGDPGSVLPKIKARRPKTAKRFTRASLCLVSRVRP
jgi:hypothetical protein